MRSLTEDEFSDLKRRIMSQLDFAEGESGIDRLLNETLTACVTISVNVLREYQKMLSEKDPSD